MTSFSSSLIAEEVLPHLVAALVLARKNVAVIFVRDSLVWASLLLCLLFGGLSPYPISPQRKLLFPRA